MKIITFGIIAFIEDQGWDEVTIEHVAQRYPTLSRVTKVFSKGERILFIDSEKEDIRVYHLKDYLLTVPFISVDSGLFRYFVET